MPLNDEKSRPAAGRWPSLERDPPAIRQRVEAMERLLENLFTFPGTRQRFGLDVLVGLVPVVGDIVGTMMGAWLVWEARNLGMSRWQIARMGSNVAIDMLLGLVPFVGLVPDFFFRSNSRNLRIVRRHLDRHHPAGATLEGEVLR